MTPLAPSESELSDPEVERYARHLILDEIGEDGQRCLKQARVAIIGLGGIGSPVGLYLAAAGVGRLRLIDPDRVDLSNLQRQIAHDSSTLGQAKVQSAARRFQALNPLIACEPVAEAFRPELLAGCDLLVDGTDSYASRSRIADAAWAAGLPLVSASAMVWDGQLLLLDPAVPGAPRYRDWFASAPAGRRSCADVGVFAPLVGQVGAQAAGLALRRLMGLPCDPFRLLLIDGRDGSTRAMRWRAP